MKILYAVLFMLWASVASAEIKVIDGDSLAEGSRQIRLIGIDAPEYLQICYDSQNMPYACGKESFEYLKNLVAKAKNVACKVKKTDRYGRDLCVCKADGLELNREMVQSGHAISYRSKAYVKAEAEAKQAQKGLWRGRFMRPELWRVLKREQQKKKKN